MSKRINHQLPPLELWGLSANQFNELMIGGCSTVDLVRCYGSPLHAVNETRLKKTAQQFRKTFETIYPGTTSVHYAFKCNPISAVVQIIQDAGLKAEIMSDFELELALKLGFKGKDIIVNGPCKTRPFLENCIQAEVKFIVVDSIDELMLLEFCCKGMKRSVNVLLRINPDYIPTSMSRSSATGSRNGSVFGFDLKGGEVPSALYLLKENQNVKFQGYHFHIGTGITQPKDYKRAVTQLSKLFKSTQEAGFTIHYFDIGGGFASPTSRGMTTREMLFYEAFGKLPNAITRKEAASFSDFAQEISNILIKEFPRHRIPELILEPGRSITSSNQLLLLTTHYVKEQAGIGKWLITDGGIGTVCLPTYYEYHEILLCNDVTRPLTEKVTITGPGCFAGDIVYRNKLMPVVHTGEVIAIMDSGAYFSQLESSFSYPHPAIVLAKKGQHRLVRRRETFDQMICRDQPSYEKLEVY